MFVQTNALDLFTVMQLQIAFIVHDKFIKSSNKNTQIQFDFNNCGHLETMCDAPFYLIFPHPMARKNFNCTHGLIVIYILLSTPKFKLSQKINCYDTYLRVELPPKMGTIFVFARKISSTSE
jgi:hypothetical protein